MVGKIFDEVVALEAKIQFLEQGRLAVVLEGQVLELEFHGGNGGTVMVRRYEIGICKSGNKTEPAPPADSTAPAYL